MAAARSVFFTLAVLASAGRAEGQEPERDAKDPSITQRAVMDQAQTAMTAEYPLEAVRSGLEGRVSISTCVDTSGKPYAPKVAKSSGHDVLDQASLDWTANGVRFKPAQAGGEAVAVCNHRFAQEWKLPESDPAPPPDARITARAPDGTVLKLTKSPRLDTPFSTFVAEYPTKFILKRVQGDVQLSMCIDVKGRPSDVTVAGSSGNEALDAYTVGVIKKARFVPGESNGVIVAVCDYRFTFGWSLPGR